MAQKHDNVKTGAFVLVGITVGFIVIVMLADFRALFQGEQTVTVFYHLADGVQGLKPGSSVTLGGVGVGSITSIEDEYDDDGALIGKLVHFSLPDRYTLYDNASINIIPPLIGTTAVLNINDVGMPLPDKPPLLGDEWVYEEGEVIEGGIAAFSFAAETVRAAGIGQDQRKQLQNIIANVDKVIAAVADDPDRLNALIANLEQVSRTLADDLPAITEEAQLMMADLRAAVTEVDGMLATANSAVDDIKAITGDAQQRSQLWFNRVDSITDTADKGLGAAREMIENIKPGAEQAVGNINAITEQARTKTMAKVEAALDKTNTAIDNAEQATELLKDLLVAQKPTLERMLANMRITSDQLKLTSIEVRRAPWRLLYKPTVEELESDNLYDAARSFALAASTLETTSESLRAIMERSGDALDTDDANVQLMLDNLHQSFEQFQQAEQVFWDALQDD